MTHDAKQVRDDFRAAVNTTARQLEKWLDRDESKRVSQKRVETGQPEDGDRLRAPPPPMTRRVWASSTSPIRVQCVGRSEDQAVGRALQQIGRALHVRETTLETTLQAVFDAAIELVDGIAAAGLNLFVRGRFLP
jgi:hypothetical protein